MKSIGNCKGYLCLIVVVFPVLLKAQVLQVVMDEVMFKPSSEYGLPSAEYVELYNTTDFELDLTAWKLMVGKNVRPLSPVTVEPHGFVIVSAAKDTSLFRGYGKVAAVSSLSLNNSSQFLALLDAQGNSVHVLAYKLAWLPEEKRAGGWSLEMRDCSFPCVQDGNWTASVAPEGGTPGSRNASASTITDEISPRPLRVVNVDSLSLRLFFAEKMLPSSLLRPDAYEITEGGTNLVPVEQVVEVGADWQSVLIRMGRPLRFGIPYTLRLRPIPCDCAGNRVEDTLLLHFGRSESIDSFDIVINEVLFHPHAGGTDFVEIYNRSDKVVDLRDLRISTVKTNGNLDTGKRVAPDGFQLLPQHYCCLSEDNAAVAAFYNGLEQDNCWELSSFPAYANASGRVVLLSRGKVVDDFAYSEEMHYPLLATTEGVSLEKIHPDLNSMEASNWHSASSLAGYATPGQPNSCFSEGICPDNGLLSLESSLFSPDGDGYEDLLKIRYHLPEQDCRASIRIFNYSGQCVKYLINNELMGMEGLVCWDGIMDNNLKAPSGCYILLFEYWSLSGKVKRLKKVVTVAEKQY